MLLVGWVGVGPRPYREVPGRLPIETQTSDEAPDGIEFAGLRSTDSAERFATTIQHLSNDLEEAPDEYEVRFLRVPTLGVACLWAHGESGEDDRLAVLTGFGRAASETIEVDEFLAEERDAEVQTLRR